MSEFIENQCASLENFKNQLPPSDELVYVPIEKANQTLQEIYNESVIDRQLIDEFAKYAAANIKKPRATHKEDVDVVKTRTIKYGPSGMDSRDENYMVKEKQTITDDYWILRSTSSFRVTTEKNGSSCEELAHTYTCLHTDGHLLTIYDSEIIDINSPDWSVHTRNRRNIHDELTDDQITDLDHTVESVYVERPGYTMNNHSMVGDLAVKKKGDGVLRLIDKLLE